MSQKVSADSIMEAGLKRILNNGLAKEEVEGAIASIVKLVAERDQKTPSPPLVSPSTYYPTLYSQDAKSTRVKVRCPICGDPDSEPSCPVCDAY